MSNVHITLFAPIFVEIMMLDMYNEIVVMWHSYLKTFMLAIQFRFSDFCTNVSNIKTNG